MVDSHTIYILSIVVIIVIFLLIILGIVAIRCPERFTNTHRTVPPIPRDVDNTNTDSIQFLDMTSNYANGLKGTSLINVSGLSSVRFPMATEISTNWYNTQGIM